MSENKRDSFKFNINNSSYAITKIKNKEQNSINEAMELLLEELEWKKFLSNYSKVLIKPNFTDVIHKPGVTTSPAVLKAMVEILSSWGKEITVIEGNGGSWLFNATVAAKNHGVMELKKEFGTEWLNISELPTKEVEKIVLNKKLKLKLPEKIHQYGEILISLPVFKNHCMTTITLGLKNLWGLIPSELRMFNHSRLNWYLPLIGDYYNHKLTLIDGLIGLEGNGPMYGDPVNMLTFFAGNDSLIVDVIGTWLMKVDPNSIGHIKKSLEFANLSLNQIKKDIPEELSFFQTELKAKKIPSNYLELLTFKSHFISKIVFDSPMTSFIYFLFNLINGDRVSIPPKELKKKFYDNNNTKNQF